MSQSVEARIYVRNIKLHDSRGCLTEQSDNLPYRNTSIQIKHKNRKINGFRTSQRFTPLENHVGMSKDKLCSKLNHLLKCRFENSFLKYR